jgi:serine/threonine protein phosphatase 1
MNVSAWKFAKKQRLAAAVRPGSRVYAIGDIHGRLDLLERLHDMITQEISRAPRTLRIEVVYLGDYIDRGPDSKAVVDLLLRGRLAGAEIITLLGNHEQALLAFLEKPESGSAWIYYGGDATLASYGINVDPMAPRSKELLTSYAERLQRALPAEHLEFLKALALRYENGDYLFVHAGVDPKRPLDQQDKLDLIWIREAFTDSAKFCGKVVVHGHTITADPVVRPNRIGIDTGAYVSGRLTCLVLEGTEQRFLTT